MDPTRHLRKTGAPPQRFGNERPLNATCQEIAMIAKQVILAAAFGDAEK
jgi:hypothetical protein